jgi:transketolase
MGGNASDYESWARRIRIRCLDMVYNARASHIGSMFSCVEIVVALYGIVTNNFQQRLEAVEDRVIFSKAHAGAVIYSMLAEMGEISAEEISGYYSDGSLLTGHLSHKVHDSIPFSLGSLGMGVGIACGSAYNFKYIKPKNARIFVIVGDGELNEGSCWEGFLFAAHHNLSNLVVIIDRNGLQSINTTESTLALNSLSSKFESFGFSVNSVPGHSYPDLIEALSDYNYKDNKKPLVIIADTVKGYGVKTFENNNLWHYRAPTAEEFQLARRELQSHA